MSLFQYSTFLFCVCIRSRKSSFPAAATSSRDGACPWQVIRVCLAFDVRGAHAIAANIPARNVKGAAMSNAPAKTPPQQISSRVVWTALSHLRNTSTEICKTNTGPCNSREGPANTGGHQSNLTGSETGERPSLPPSRYHTLWHVAFRAVWDIFCCRHLTLRQRIAYTPRVG